MVICLYCVLEVQVYDWCLCFLIDFVVDEKGVFFWVKCKVWNEYFFVFFGEDYQVNINLVIGFVLGIELEFMIYDWIY